MGKKALSMKLRTGNYSTSRYNGQGFEGIKPLFKLLIKPHNALTPPETVTKVHSQFEWEDRFQHLIS